MPAVDFEAWATPNLEIVLGGHTFVVRPPSTEASKKIIALAVRGEVNLKIVQGEIPMEIQAVLDMINPNEHVALGGAHDEMVAAGIPKTTIDRVTYFAVFYWAKGRTYAEAIAHALWDTQEAGEGAGPKDSSPPKTGRRTGSGSRTKTAGTRTTGKSTTP